MSSMSRPPGRVSDSGGGCGRASGAVVGIDISEEMLDVLARSIEGAGLGTSECN